MRYARGRDGVAANGSRLSLAFGDRKDGEQPVGDEFENLATGSTIAGTWQSK